MTKTWKTLLLIPVKTTKTWRTLRSEDSELCKNLWNKAFPWWPSRFDQGPSTNPWEVIDGDLKTINCHTSHKTNPARRPENRLHLASRWMLMPRSKTFCLMSKNLAMESNMKSTDQLENSLKLFKTTWPEVEVGGGGPPIHRESSLKLWRASCETAAGQNEQISADRKLWRFIEISS